MSGIVSASAFKLFAQTSPGLEATLLQELRNIGIKGRMRDDISHIQFFSNYEGIFKVLHEVRTIESLKIQIGPEFRARSEDELAKNLQKLPWNAFLPIERLHEFNQPQILSKSYRSNLYHEKLITSIVEKQMNLLNVRKEYKQLQTLVGGQGDRTGSRSLNKEIQLRKREIEGRKQLIIDNRALQKNNDTNNNSNQLETLPQLPNIHLYLVKDKARVLMKLHLDSLHKHSLKPKVGWAPIKEGIVAGTLISMDFQQRFDKELKVWDPFCGSGSIVLELLSMMFQRKIRDKFDFFFLKNFPQEKYEQFLQGKLDNTQDHINDVSEVNDKKEEEDDDETEESQKNDEKNKDKASHSTFGINLKDISILASDISGDAIKYSLENFRYSNLEEAINEFIRNQALKEKDIKDNKETSIDEKEDIKVSTDEENIQDQKEEYSMNPKRQLHNKGIKDETKLNELAPFYIQETFCDKRVRFIRSDFETLSKMINLRGYTIITNLPFGIRSKEHIDDQELIGSFKRFSKVIQKNLHKLNDVFVYTTVHQKYHRDHFIHISQMSWTIKQKYNLGGIEIGLFQLNKDISATTKSYQVYDEQEAIQKDDKLAVLENKLSKVKLDDEELSQHLKDIIGDRSDTGLQRQQQSKKSIIQKDSDQCSPALVPRGVKPQELALLTPRERNEQNKLLEQKDNMRNLRKASEIEETIKKDLDQKAHTPRQIKSIAIRRKLEYAKALRLRALMQRDSYVQSQQEKEIERRIQSKRNRLNVEFIKSVMNSVGVEDKEEALDQIQEKLDKTAEQKVEKTKSIEKKRENKKKAPRWY